MANLNTNSRDCQCLTTTPPQHHNIHPHSSDWVAWTKPLLIWRDWRRLDFALNPGSTYSSTNWSTLSPVITSNGNGNGNVWERSKEFLSCLFFLNKSFSILTAIDWSTQVELLCQRGRQFSARKVLSVAECVVVLS